MNKSNLTTIDFIEESYNALDLYNLKIEKLPKLLDPFLQKVGLASLVGTSDAGKSTLLRQLSLAIAFKHKTFLKFDLDISSGKVLYISTEDDPTSIAHSIRRQIESISKEYKSLDKSLLKNIEFIFDPHNLLEKLTKKMLNKQYDLIIIDAFADVFNKEINANTQVRQFLNGFDKLAKQHNSLILFLHHIGKKTMSYDPSKNSIIGSQAFEAKMRSVLELRPNLSSNSLKDLWVLKSNFLESKYKTKSYILNFDNLIFTYTGNRGTTQSAKISNPTIIKKVMELHKKKLSYRDIATKLKGTQYAIGKTAIGKIIKSTK